MRAVLSALGGRDMKTLTPPDVVAFVRDAQKKRGPFAAHRARGVLSQVFQYAIAAGLVDWNPVQQIAGALTPLPPSQHLSVIQTPDEARAVLRDIDAYTQKPLIRLGLLLLAYTFVRPGELAGARWPEVDLDAREWRIPSERMKMRREHVVPLRELIFSPFCSFAAILISI